jgi:hypothetical protein
MRVRALAITLVVVMVACLLGVVHAQELNGIGLSVSQSLLNGLMEEALPYVVPHLQNLPIPNIGGVEHLGVTKVHWNATVCRFGSCVSGCVVSLSASLLCVFVSCVFVSITLCHVCICLCPCSWRMYDFVHMAVPLCVCDCCVSVCVLFEVCVTR